MLFMLASVPSFRSTRCIPAAMMATAATAASRSLVSLLNAANDLGIDLARSFMIGDRWRDVDAGARAGCRTVFLDFGYRERGPTDPPTVSVKSLEEGVAWILQQAGK